MSSSKHRPSETDLLSIIASLESRVSKLERSPRIGNTAIDTGGLTVTDGDIIIKDNAGNEVIRIFNNDPPEIRFAPLGADTDHIASLYANEETFGGFDQTIGRLQVRTDPGLAQDGGALSVFRTGVKLNHIDNATGAEGAFEAGIINGTAGMLHLIGRWLNGIQVSGTDAVLTGSLTTAVANSTTVTYTFTYASTIAPVIGFLSSGGAVSWSITAQSTASFTVAWGGAAASKTLNMWNIRL